MIRLHDLGIGAGSDGTPLDVEEADISTLAADPVEASRTVVTMASGDVFLVSESVPEIEDLIKANLPGVI